MRKEEESQDTVSCETPVYRYVLDYIDMKESTGNILASTADGYGGNTVSHAHVLLKMAFIRARRLGDKVVAVLAPQHEQGEKVAHDDAGEHLGGVPVRKRPARHAPVACEGG